MKASWMLFLAMAAAAAVSWAQPPWVALVATGAGIVGVTVLCTPRLRARLMPLMLVMAAMAVAATLLAMRGSLPFL